MATQSPSENDKSTSQPVTKSNAAFEDAYKSFFDSLPSKDQELFSPCATAKDLIDSLGKLKTLTKVKKRGSIWMRIVGFTESLQPYLNIVDIMIQSNPKYAALIWGSLRLVLQLASNFSTFFDKLTTLLQNISIHLPQHDQIAHFCSQAPEFTSNLKSYIEKSYGDLFQLFRAVANLFISGDRRLKRTSVLIREILWKPFDIRFKDFEQLFRANKELITIELGLIQSKMAQATQDMMSKGFVCSDNLKASKEAYDRLESTCSEKTKVLLEELETLHSYNETTIKLQSKADRLKSWLSPLSCEYDVASYSQYFRESDTCDWIFSNHKFHDWAQGVWQNDTGTMSRKVRGNTLWIQGSPGCGKTTLVSLIIEKLANDATPWLQQKQGVYYYFLDSQSSRRSLTTASVCRSILAQILHYHGDDESIVDKFAFLQTNSWEGSEVADQNQLIELVKICFLSLGGFLVIDGMDECSDTEVLAQLLLWLSKNSATKILLSSRPSVTELVRTIPQVFRLSISKEDTSGDIRKYLTTQVNILIEEEYFPPDTSFIDIVNHLVNGADGMFLWARLMIQYLKSPAITPSRRLREVTAVILPEALSDMYTRITHLIGQSDRPQRELAQAAIQWVLHSEYALTPSELHEALTSGDVEHDENGSHGFKDFEDTMSIVTKGLIEFKPSMDMTGRSRMTSRFIHLTTIEFFLSDLSNSDIFSLPPLWISNLRILNTCVGYVLFHSPKEIPISGSNPKRSMSTLDYNGSFAVYAGRSWIYHLNKIFPSGIITDVSKVLSYSSDYKELIRKLLDFLRWPLAITAWLESIFLVNSLPVIEHLLALHSQAHLKMARLAKTLSQINCDHEIAPELGKLASTLKSFVEDMSMIVRDWGKDLCQTPAIVWNEVNAFAKSEFLIQQTRTQVESMVPKSEEGVIIPVSKSKAFSLVSKSGYVPLLGNATCVLSIWPSDLFIAERHKSSVSCGIFDGWFAHYEVWCHGEDSARIADLKVPLDPDELWILFKQSLRRPRGELLVSLPLAIGDDLLCFMILRSFFKLRPQQTGGRLSWLLETMVVEFPKELSTFWSITDRAEHWFYSYTFQIGPYGIVLFLGSAVNTLNGEVYSSHIAVFRAGVENGSHLKFVGRQSVDDFELLQHAVFHPTHSIVLLVFPNDVRIWQYEAGPNEIHRIWKRKSGKWWDGIVNISSCGKNILISGELEPLPIPSRYLLNPYSEAQKSWGSLSKARTTGELAGTSISNLQQGIVISSDNSDVITCGNMMQTRRVRDENGIDVVDFDADGNVKRRTHLLSLPTGHKVQNTTQTIFGPVNGSTNFRIVMDKNSEKSYSVNKDEHHPFPLVIRRDVSDIVSEENSSNLTKPRRPQNRTILNGGEVKRRKIS